jgi:TPP-dependent pyruvate/acetoin dehydrogenase alpha subunit
MNPFDAASSLERRLNAARRLDYELLFRMKRIRHVEETIATRYRDGKMRCPTHLSTGQEAVAAAAGLALRSDDFAVSTHRSHAHYLGKGGDLNAMLAEIHGKATGCARGRGGSMHLADPRVNFTGSTAIVANSIPLGVGLALSAQLHGTDQVSCIFFGDGAVEEGAFYESVNFAAVRKLPVLFLCENNLYSVYSGKNVRQPIERQIHQMVAAMGVISTHGDGNDAPAAYARILDAVYSIRHEGGPRFLEFDTYRWREHCGPNYDNDLGYREESEFLEWKARDPIGRLEWDMLNDEVISDVDVDAMQQRIEVEVNAAFASAEAAPWPDANEALHGVYKA